MGVTEDAIDAAAEFVGPFLDRASNQAGSSTPVHPQELQVEKLVGRAVSHLRSINAAEQAKAADALYDGSLVGIVYGLLDLITSQGILPYLPPGVAFGQRPRSVLLPFALPAASRSLLSDVTEALLPILEQNGTGVQPLLTQRVLPDLISATAELGLSPYVGEDTRSVFEPHFDEILQSTAISRLLPILTSYLQQSLPQWLKQRLAKELATIPLRPHGIRHTVEFLSLSHLSKHSQVSQQGAESSSQIPISVEAVTQASKLLAAPPSGISLEEWIAKLAPQLWELLDGKDGKELSRAAGQIIAGGFLNRKSTGAPGTIGWELFARPLINAINPPENAEAIIRKSTSDRIIVHEQNLKLALKRLSAIATSYSRSGLVKRLVGPIVLPLWGLLIFAKSKFSTTQEWTALPRNILLRFMTIAIDPKQIDNIMTNLFWSGPISWTFGRGSSGGIEIRLRKQGNMDTPDIGGLLARVGQPLDEQVQLLISLLSEANVDNEAIGRIFVNTTKRWLNTSGGRAPSRPSLTDEEDTDPLKALTDAKISEALATEFHDNFARSPQHIMELMGQLINNFVEEHKVRRRKLSTAENPTRANLRNFLDFQADGQTTRNSGVEDESEDIVLFALSILSTIIGSKDFKPQPKDTNHLQTLLPPLQYLSDSHQQLSISPHIVNAATNLLQTLQPQQANSGAEDLQAQHRLALKEAVANLTSSDPPNRTWALSIIRNLIQDPAAFPVFDVPSTAHILLSAAIADPESYVHTAAIPVLVKLAIRAPNPTLRIIIDAFVDVNERSLRLKKEQEFIEALDFRLRVGETLNNIVLNNDFWSQSTTISGLKMLVEATLSLASRRGQRHRTLAKRNEIAEAERMEQVEGERAWGGAIPNLVDPEGENAAEQQERDALLKLVQGWEATGIGEDVRIRASALSILGNVMEKRIGLLSQVTVDAALQIVILVLTMETSIEKTILRRAAVLVVMGLLRALDAWLEEGKESAKGLGLQQSREIERVMRWVNDEDNDDLVKSHAENVLEGLETLNMKKLYKIRDEELKLGTNLSLEGNLRGLQINHQVHDNKRPPGAVVEEID